VSVAHAFVLPTFIFTRATLVRFPHSERSCGASSHVIAWLSFALPWPTVFSPSAFFHFFALPWPGSTCPFCIISNIVFFLALNVNYRERDKQRACGDAK
jgi:hypothetical protein